MLKKIILTILCFLVLIVCFFGINILNSRKTNEIETLKENTKWKITQYGRDDGAQMMGYTIEGNNYGLIIIDGGYYNDLETQELYKEKIKQHNNTVDAWIVTHYDSDHAGAYMALKESEPNIIVKNLYVQGMPSLELCKEKAPWETEWEMYEKYLALPEQERTIVKSGFEVEEIIGLRYKVLSVYDEWMGEKLTSLLNNGSMIFKLYGNEESFLYCADVTSKEVEQNLLSNYKEDLPSEYVQIPHHGNSIFSEDFYKLVNPKEAFFDAPTWIIENKNNVSWYTIEKTREMFESWGVKVNYFATTPNYVEMK